MTRQEWTREKANKIAFDKRFDFLNVEREILSDGIEEALLEAIHKGYVKASNDCYRIMKDRRGEGE